MSEVKTWGTVSLLVPQKVSCSSNNRNLLWRDLPCIPKAAWLGALTQHCLLGISDWMEKQHLSGLLSIFRVIENTGKGIIAGFILTFPKYHNY